MISLRDSIIFGTCALVGLGGYLMLGRPGLPDQPMQQRQAELAQKIADDASSLTLAESLASLELRAQQEPNRPEPHFYIGQLLTLQGRYQEAERAYRAALRRDETFVDAMVALADNLVGGQAPGEAIPADAARLYLRAYQLDETQVKAGMWAAMARAQAGDDAGAAELMRYVFSRLPEDDPRRARFAPMLEAIGDGPGAPPDE